MVKGHPVERRPVVVVAFLAVVVLLAGGWWLIRCRAEGEEPATGLPEGYQEVVSDHVIDGDSLRVRAPAAGPVVPAGRVELRLLAIDAPEMRGADGRPQCYADAAYRRLRALAPAGAQLRIVHDRERRDRYGRYLVYAWTADGIFVNRVLALEGFVRSLTVRPNVAFRSAIEDAAADARSNRRGLWGAC